MPHKSLKSCKYPRCPNLVEVGKTYCNKHKYLGKRKSSTEQGYNYRWQKESKKFLEQNPYCVACLKRGKNVKATVVDHIVPHKGDMDLFWDRGNWQALCIYHHNVKTGKGR